MAKLRRGSTVIATADSFEWSEAQNGWIGGGAAYPDPLRSFTVLNIPAAVTNFQARAILMTVPSPTGTPGRTMFQDVDDTLRAAGGRDWQAWEYANTVVRAGPLVNTIAIGFGLSQATIDDLFVAAAQIEV